MIRILHLIVFLVGLAVIGWIGAGYLGSNPLALAVTAVIGVCYVAGALELLRYQQATNSLTRGLDGLKEAPAELGPWLDALHPSLRNAVRLRIEGERVGLPGPAMTPYLVGLLVLLGMLGTFLGMVATLRGTGLALEGAADLQAMRASLAAPVKGLGFAFGTSVAGVATSAMLGLLSALCRRARLQAGQWLDTKAATTLRGFSVAHQRDESFKLLRGQAEALPALAEHLKSMMTTMERQSQALNERLLAGQEAFHGKTEAVYGRLANSVESALTHSVTESAQAAGAAIQPAVQTTMETLARETTAWRDTITQALQQQLDGLSTRLEQTSAAVAGNWGQALTEQQRANQALSQDLRSSLEQFASSFDSRASSLLADVSSRLDSTTGTLSASTEHTAQSWTQALAEQQRSNQLLNQELKSALNQFSSTFDSRAAALLADVSARLESTAGTLAESTGQTAQTWTQALAEQQRSNQVLNQDLRVALAQFSSSFDSRAGALLADVSARLDNTAATLANSTDHTAQSWTAALAEQQQANQALGQELRDALQQFASSFDSRAHGLIADVATRLDSTAATLASSSDHTAHSWTQALAAQQQANLALGQELRDALQQFASSFDSRAHGLIADVATRLDSTADKLASSSEHTAQSWNQALAEQQRANQALGQDLRSSLDQFSSNFDTRASGLIADVATRLDATANTLTASTELTADAWAQALENQSRGNSALAGQLEGALAQFALTFETRSAALLADVAARLASTTDSVSATTAGVADIWKQALAEQQQAQTALTQDLRGALDQFVTGFEQRSTSLVDRVSERLDGNASAIAGNVQTALGAWQAALGEQQRGQESQVIQLRNALDEFSSTFETRSEILVDGIASRLDSTAEAVAAGTGQALDNWRDTLGVQAQRQEELVQELRGALDGFASAFETRSAGLVDNVAARMDQTTDHLAEAWHQALARHEAASGAMADSHRAALDAAAERFESHSASLLAGVDQAHAQLHGELAARDEARLSAWNASLAQIADAMRLEWEETGNQTLARQQEICDTFAAAVSDLTAQAESQTQHTIGEIQRLLEAASQAPKAAAEMVAELRQKLSESMAQDNAMLEERGHLLETVDTLLKAINHASNEQRSAVDALVQSSSELLERVGKRFTEHVEGETGKLSSVADQVTGSAAEVASLGEAFGAAVEMFGASNDKLAAHLERIEAALDKSLARSDEQLAYYVAQAREVIDLSMLSQKQIMHELRNRDGAEAA